ncbi:hypothetical protein DFA_04696 [Cavenderia fasciculata]|uniref:Uncharacterized protein n=1 Tax=Cavenderia fasciculata TaxID=261658 RepID=F4PQA3_CACFS|nr:uncharacterized protein DFA_04696 [Cavenderia fasciculata]EGG22566.1 hypothetical protein DFA_04696 [Cavenderia fasciculata]|eukprot:XP_004360417.1 hypothetical protein DFA_04696 [Cavenderia fasciculata]
MDDYNRGVLEYTMANRTAQALKRTHQTRTISIYGIGLSDPLNQSELHVNMMLQSEMKQNSLSRDQMCPLHQLSLESGHEPNFVRDDSSRSFNWVTREDSCRWMRTMALLSKRIFAFISTSLFTDIVMDTTADTCVQEFLQNVEKININNAYLVEKVSTIKSLIDLTPNLRSITFNCEVSKSSWLELFRGTTLSTVKSIKFGNAVVMYPVVTGYIGCGREREGFEIGSSLVGQPTSCLTKIVLPHYFDWNGLGQEFKQNLQVISLLYTNDKPRLNAIDFPRLRHVHTQLEGVSIIPENVHKVSYLEDVPLDAINILSTLNISTLRVFKSKKDKKDPEYNKIPTLKKIIIFSKADVDETNVNHLGFDYFGSTYSVQLNQRKLIYLKQQQQQQNETSYNNHNNNNSINIKDNNIVNNIITSTNYNNIILPNSIIQNIIGMTWKLRERCTCVYEKETIQKWVDIGQDILRDEKEIDRFNQMKNNCPTHFSHTTLTQMYRLLTYNLKSSNRSKLQLALINKDIFAYITKNCFPIINLEYYEWLDVPNHANNPYCVAFKHFTTLRANGPKNIFPVYSKTSNSI